MQWNRLYRTAKAKLGWAITLLYFVKWLADVYGEGQVVRDWTSHLPQFLQLLSEAWVTPIAIILGLGLIVGSLWGPGTVTTPFDNVRWLPERYRPRIRIRHEYIVGAVVIVAVICVGVWAHYKTLPSAIATPIDTGDETNRIEHLLSPVQDSTYRQLVASVIYAFDPHATLSVDDLVGTPDGIRRVDIEVRSSSKDGVPFLTAIDVLDLPSGRKADITSVDAADSKRADIKADAMLVCSNTGFEEDAISKAKRKHIGLISVLRQGDKRVRAIIEEEVYLRKITLNGLRFTWNGSGLTNGGMPAYSGGTIADWLELHAGLMAAYNPNVTFEVKKEFNFKDPVHIDENGKEITLTSMSVDFTPQVRWFSQTVQIDAQAGIYDYVRGRVRLAPGGNSYTVRGVDFDHAAPLVSAPPTTQLGVGLQPGEFEFFFALVTPAPLPGTNIPKIDGLIRSEDLRLKLTDAELRALKSQAGRPVV